MLIKNLLQTFIKKAYLFNKTTTKNIENFVRLGSSLELNRKIQNDEIYQSGLDTKREDYINGRNRIMNKLETLSETELNTLTQEFQKPGELIDKIIKPYIDLYPSKAPKLSYQQIFNGKFWKVVYELEWPIKLKIETKSCSREKALYFAQLLICRHFKTNGLIFKQDIVNTNHLLFDQLAKSGDAFYFKTMPSIKTWKSSKKYWIAKLKINWPKSLVVEAEGLTQNDAIRNAHVIAIIKLKALNIIGANNQTIQKLDKMPSFINTYKTEFKRNLDFEIYTDASPHGYGAYLVNVRCRKEPVLYIYDKYPENLKHMMSKYMFCGLKLNDEHFDAKLEKMENKIRLHNYGNSNKCNKLFNYYIYNDFIGFYSEIVEKYSCIASIYAWRKQLRNSRVLIYNDNLKTAQLNNSKLNSSLHDLECFRDKNGILDINKLLNLNMNIIVRRLYEKYSIEILFEPIAGTENYIADLLSRFLDYTFNDEIRNRLKRDTIKTLSPYLNEILVQHSYLDDDKKLIEFFKSIEYLVK